MILKNYPPQDLHFEHYNLNEEIFPFEVYRYPNYILLQYFYSGLTCNRLYKALR